MNSEPPRSGGAFFGSVRDYSSGFEVIKILDLRHLAPGQGDGLGGTQLEIVVFADQMSLPGIRTMPDAKGNYDLPIVLNDSSLVRTVANHFRA